MIEANKAQPGVVYEDPIGDLVEVLYRSRAARLVSTSDNLTHHIIPKTMTFKKVFLDKRVTLEKKYVTRSGDPVRVLAIDLAGEQTVAAVITRPDGREVLQQYYPRGSVTLSPEGSELDLIEVPEYETGDLLECRTFIGWRAWYSYVSQLETGVHLVRMDVTPEDADPEDKYSVFKSQDIRPRGKEIETE